jgi:VIT1/CCC1 family predicted Fe2+/Mn2+ transporter
MKLVKDRIHGLHMTSISHYIHYRYLDSAISSIRRIILTVSAANSIALVLTSRGCSTLSSAILFLTPPILMLTPAFFSPRACRCLRSVTTLIELRPAFSARVVGMTSRASAKAFQHIASVPVRDRARVESC